MRIDINCDVGEGLNNEHLLMPYITSCNIACGGHFGDKNTIDETIEIATQNNVLIGAHPSFPDTENFGRKLINISDHAFKESIQNQLNLFMNRLSFFDIKLHHIKPHGALYNAIAVDEKLAILFIHLSSNKTNINIDIISAFGLVVWGIISFVVIQHRNTILNLFKKL